MNIDTFNSRLLDLIQKHYKGAAYGKLLEAFDVIEKTNSLEQACSSLFKESIGEISPPSPEALEEFGKGNIAQDYLTLLYMDDFLARVFGLIKAENYQAALDLINNDQISVSQQIPRELQFRIEIQIGFFNFLQNKLEQPQQERPKVSYPIRNLDDLAFCGICALLDRQLDSEGYSLFALDFFLDPENQPRQEKNLDSDEMGFSEKDLTTNIYISKKVLDSMGTPGRVYGRYYHKQFKTFIYCNDWANFTDSRPHLNLSLSNLLSSSSFIWEEAIFGLSPEEVEAMSPDQRILTLLKNKSGVIDRCMSNLSGYTETLELQKNQKPQMMALAEQIKQALGEKNFLEKQLKTAESQKVKAQEGLKELGVLSQEAPATTLSTLLGYVEKGIEIPPLEGLDKLDHLALQLFNNYKQAFFQTAKLKEKALEKAEELESLKTSLQELFEQFINTASDQSLQDERFGTRFLESYTVCSFILFNKEIFPDLPMAAYKKEQGAKRVLKLFERKSKEEKYLKLRAMERLKDNAAQDIQELLTQRADKIFSTFAQPSDQGRIKSLTNKDINAIIKVSKDLENATKKDAESFYRLRKILEQMLIQDEVFWGNIDRLANRLSPQKIAKLQAHMNACLLFLNPKNPSIAGIPNTMGFSKLIDNILYALGDDGIKVKRFQDKIRIISALEERSLSNNKDAFDQAIKQEVISSARKDIDRLTVEVLPPEKDKETQQLEHIVGRLKTFIFEKMHTNFSGGNQFLSTSAPRKNIRWMSVQDFIQKMPLAFPDLSNRDISLIRSLLENVPRDEKSQLQLLKDFVIENNLSVDIGSSERDLPGFLGRVFYNTEEEVFSFAAACQVLDNVYQEKVRALEDNQSYQVIQKYEGIPERQADLFIPDLIRWYEKKQADDLNNQDISLNLYRQFLPIFLSSFFQDIQDMGIGQQFFMQKRMNLIQQFPEAKQPFADIQRLLETKRDAFIELAKHLETTFANDGFFNESWLSSTHRMIKNKFQTATRDFMTDVKEFVFVGLIFTLALQMTPLGRIKNLATLLGFLGSYAWKGKVKDAAKQFYMVLYESCRYIVPGKFEGLYTPEGVNSFIISLLETSVDAEVKMLTSRKWETLQHQMAFSLFLQEEFSVLRNLKTDLAMLPNRLNYLFSKALEHTNLSSMALNFFYMSNKELFSLLPEELLKGSASPDFEEAISEYIEAYENLITSLKAAYPGSEEDKKLSYGEPSPFKQQLIEQAKRGELSLRFARNSKVYKCLSQMRSNLNEEATILILKESQIVPTDEVHLSQQANNLKQLFKRVGDLLEKQERSLREQMRALMKKIQPHFSSLDKHLENKALGGIVSSYYMVRLSLGLAKRLYSISKEGQINPEDSWIAGSGQTPKTVLTSLLFRESLSTLRKTAEFAQASNIPSALDALSKIAMIEEMTQEFLTTGTLRMPSFTNLNKLIKDFQKIVTHLEDIPQIMIPVLFEYERNQNILLPQIFYAQAASMIKKESGEERQLVLQENFKSKALYLTNDDIDIFFTSQGMRGVGLSPYMVNALQDMIYKQRDQKFAKYLGIIEDRYSQYVRGTQAIPNFQRQMQALSMGQGEEGAPAMNPLVGSPNRGIGNSNVPVPEGMSYRPTANQRPEIVNTDPNQDRYALDQFFTNSPQKAQGLNSNPQTGNLPVGRNTSDNLPAGGQSNLAGSSGAQGNVQGVGPGNRNSQGQQQGSIAPMFVPMMMEGQAQGDNMLQNRGAVNEEMKEATPQLQQAAETENRNMVQVDAQGGSSTFDSVAFYNSLDERGKQAMELSNRLADEANARLAAQEPISFMGRGDAPEYRNPHNPMVQDLVQPRPQSNLGNIALVGGGLLLGAALLGSMLQDDDKDKKR